MNIKEYSYIDIISISESDIKFYDGYVLNLEECKKNWAINRSISFNDTSCVASRDITSNPPYFLFHLAKGIDVKLCFKYKGLLRKRRAEKSFMLFQAKINSMGYSTYDES